MTAAEWAQQQIPLRALDPWILNYMEGYAAQAVARERERLMRCIEGVCGHGRGCVVGLRASAGEQR